MVFLIRTQPVRVASKSFFITLNAMATSTSRYSVLKQQASCFSQTTKMSKSATDTKEYKAVVLGAGPAGIAVVGNLLEQKVAPILWLDYNFKGGRIGRFYREVPSNTKVKRFLAYANAVGPFRRIIENQETDKNAYSALKALDEEGTCSLSKTADLCKMFTAGLDESKGVYKKQGRVMNVTKSATSGWDVKFEPLDKKQPKEFITTKNLILCTGAQPIKHDPPVNAAGNPMIRPHGMVSLDTALQPSRLPKALSNTEPTTIAVIGASHSAILVLMNLFNIAIRGEKPIRIKWFTRHPLRYAEEKDGWILRDNTGLKGDAAIWAKENLEDETFKNSPVNKFITKISTSKATEQADYQKHLQDCTHMIQAVGFEKIGPRIYAKPWNGEESGTRETLDLAYDDLNGWFTDKEGKKVEGLFGAGIAYPEKVTDPEGNVEHSVGFIKFMNYLRRVMPTWSL